MPLSCVSSEVLTRLRPYRASIVSPAQVFTVALSSAAPNAMRRNSEIQVLHQVFSVTHSAKAFKMTVNAFGAKEKEAFASAGRCQLYRDRQTGPTEYELSLGKIVDTLKCDYPAMFDRKPDYQIYDDRIVFQLGMPFHGVSALYGKRAYSRALQALQHLAWGFVQDGSVTFHICDGKPYGKTLRVPWTCKGRMVGLNRPIYVSAISLYDIAERSSGTNMSPNGANLSHTIHHHTIEFLEIQPPSLRSLLLSLWWQPQSQGQLVGHQPVAMHNREAQVI